MCLRVFVRWRVSASPFHSRWLSSLAQHTHTTSIITMILFMNMILYLHVQLYFITFICPSARQHISLHYNIWAHAGSHSFLRFLQLSVCDWLASYLSCAIRLGKSSMCLYHRRYVMLVRGQSMVCVRFICIFFFSVDIKIMAFKIMQHKIWAFHTHMWIWFRFSSSVFFNSPIQFQFNWMTCWVDVWTANQPTPKKQPIIKKSEVHK